MTAAGTGSQMPRRFLRDMPALSSAWLERAAFALVFLGAAVIRFWFLNRQIWTAEAWVANSVTAGSWSEMFYYPSWLQTTPPLFLVLDRFAVGLLGVSNWSLRLVPFLFGLGSVVLVAVLSRRVFSLPLALLCTSLVALSPPEVEYSKELKQYSGDAAATALVLLVLWDYLARPDRRRYGRMLLVFGLGLWLSHTVIMFLPLAACVLLFAAPPVAETARKGILRAQILRAAGLTLLAGVLGSAEYVLFVRPNLTPLLLNYWKEGFPHFLSVREVFHFYAQNFAGLALYFFIGSETKTSLMGALASSSGAVQAVALVLSTAALGGLAVRFRHSSRHRRVALLCGLPVLTLAALNLVHQYPVGTRRVMLFLLPCVALGVTLVLESVWVAMLAPVFDSKTRFVAAALGVVSVAAVLGASAKADRWRPYPEEDEDCEAALRYLRSAVQPGDLVYIHASLEESAKLYVRLLNWKNPPIVYGNTGWPCCIRDQQAATVTSGKAGLQRELLELRAQAGGRTLWLLFTGRLAHWQQIQRNDPELLVNGLRDRGCAYQRRVLFPEVALHQMSCRP